LTHTLRDHPMLDANLRAAVWIGPTRDVARGVDSRGARLEILVDGHAFIHRETSRFRELRARPHSDAEHDEIRRELRIVVENHGVLLDTRWFASEMEHDAFLFMQGLDERAELGAEDTLERERLGSDDVHLDIAGA